MHSCNSASKSSKPAKRKITLSHSSVKLCKIISTDLTPPDHATKIWEDRRPRGNGRASGRPRRRTHGDEREDQTGRTDQANPSFGRGQMDKTDAAILPQAGSTPSEAGQALQPSELTNQTSDASTQNENTYCQAKFAHVSGRSLLPMESSREATARAFSRWRMHDMRCAIANETTPLA